MADFERMTEASLLRHMNDDPCVICGIGGHDAYDGDCPKLNVIAGMDSPLAKIYGVGKANAARQAIVRFRKAKKPRYQEPAAKATVGTTADVTAEALAKVKLEDQVKDVAENSAKSAVEAPAKAVVTDPAKDAAVVADEDATLNRILQSVDRSVVGLKKVLSVTQADPVDTHAAPFAEVQGKSDGSGVAFQPKLVLSKAKEAQFPLRKDFASTSSEVFTNHFEVSFKPNTHFFVYEILKIPAGKSKRKAHYIFKTAEDTWDMLRNNRQYYATDCVKTIIAWKNLHESLGYQPIIPGDDGTYAGAVWQPEAFADGSERVQLFIKFHRELDLNGLHAYMDASRNGSDPDFNVSPIVSALNLAIANSLTSKVFQQSSNKFFVKCGAMTLGGNGSLKSLCAIRGYYFTIKPGMQKILLNVNPATSAFFNDITVGEFLADRTFSPDEQHRLLKTLRVYVMHNRKSDPANQDQIDRLNKTSNRVKTIFGFGRKFNDPSMTFSNAADTQKRKRVEQHLREVFGKDFNPNLEAINVGNEKDPVYYPREYLRILPYQVYKKLLPERLIDDMLSMASHVPPQTRRFIEIEGMQSLGLDPSQKEQALPGCPQLLIKPMMLKIPSAQMQPIVISYGKETPSARPNDKAQWNLGKLRNFAESPGAVSKKRINYLLLVEDDMSDRENTVNIYTTAFNTLLGAYNICGGASRLAFGYIQGVRGIPYDAIKAKIRTPLQNMKRKFPQADFVILLLKTKSIPVYSAFKDVVDRYEAMQSLCMTQAPNFRGRCNTQITQYMANIMMKVNLKFGGTNHKVQFGANPKSQLHAALQGTLVLGADVTHPGSGSLTGCPSIAAVVGSIDSSVIKFRGSMRLQRTCKKEIIDDLEVMVSERIQAYFRATRVLPKKILYYRDGVSTGQFPQVRDEELPQIRSACEAAGCPSVQITVVVAVKRHSTRFFPATSLAAKNGNCNPGTLVDRAITSPHYADFYLQSHHGLKGTAIPTHYMIIANEIGFKDTELQELTYKLCYTYARATVGVSYPPPAYYADRLCDRGRAYMRNWFSPDKGSAEYNWYLDTSNTIKQGNQNRLANRKASLMPTAPQPGKSTPRKGTEEVAVEREHEKHVQGLLAKEVLNRAVQEWNKVRKDGPGPWAQELDDTMFWM